MEVIQSRYGLDRSIEKLNHTTFRVMGDSLFVRTSSNRNGDTTTFDFEGGPCLTVGGKIKYGNLNWKITEINETSPMYDKLSGCTLTVTPMY
jgi:hypothetical protein